MTTNIKPLRRAAIIIFFTGLFFQLGLQAIMRPHAYRGYLYQGWTSEAFMQTVSIEDLRKAPWESLKNIHIQPPGYDALRAFLVQLWPTLEIHEALKKVDLTIYFLWTIAYSLGGVIIFLWLAEAANPKFAFISALLFFLHPGWIEYATFLDTTLPSALLILWMFYLLWKTYRGNAPVFSLTLILLLLFFTRSLFQWQFIPVIATSLLLLKMPFKKTVLIITVISVIFGAYLIKQKREFGIASTSSFTGINLTSALNVGDFDHPYAIDGFEEHPEASLPSVLNRTEKISGTINYNNYQYLWYNKKLTNRVVKFLKTYPARYLISNTLENLEIYFKPSSRYTTRHVIVDRLPWRNIYDRLFSTPFQQIFLIISGVIALSEVFKKKAYAAALAMFLPALYIFSLCVLFEKGENNRYKFFLEPVFFAFILNQFYILYNRIVATTFHFLKNEK